jgi:hypothetical protein
MQMNKLFPTLTIIAGLAASALTGCSKTNSGATTIDTAKVQSAFSTASAVDKDEIETAIAAVKAGDYASAVDSLKQAASSVNLTPEQKQSLQDLLAQAQAKLGGAATEAVDKAKTAAGGAAAKAKADAEKAVGK